MAGPITAMDGCFGFAPNFLFILLSLSQQDTFYATKILFFLQIYSKRYFKDAYLVTGHTPTLCITGNRNFEVYEANGHIAIDCGCVFGGRLAAYCLETGTAIYTDNKK